MNRNFPLSGLKYAAVDRFGLSTAADYHSVASTITIFKKERTLSVGMLNGNKVSIYRKSKTENRTWS